MRSVPGCRRHVRPHEELWAADVRIVRLGTANDADNRIVTLQEIPQLAPHSAKCTTRVLPECLMKVSDCHRDQTGNGAGNGPDAGTVLAVTTTRRRALQAAAASRSSDASTAAAETPSPIRSDAGS